MENTNESFMRDNSKKQMDKLNKQITAAGGDIGANSNTDMEANGVYMDNPFTQKKRHIDTYEHYIKNDAIIKTPTDKTNNSKFGKVTKMSEAVDTDKYEDVVFLQGSEAEEPLRILSEEGEDAAMNYLMQWHDHGNHMGSDELKHGSSDETYEVGGYHMAWNTSLGYIGLQYEFDINEAKKVSGGDIKGIATVIKGKVKDNPTEADIKKLLPDAYKDIADGDFDKVLNSLVDLGVDLKLDESKKASKKVVKDETKSETHDKTIIWKYEDYIIGGKNHVNTTNVEDKDRPFIDNTPDNKEAE